MNIKDIVQKINNKIELSFEELEFVFNGYLNNLVSDEEMTSVLKAICKYSLSDKNAIELTDIFIKSGDTLPLCKKYVDKHSTGGVGDKTTLIILPIIASIGIKVSKMSGGALGYTGGTIDKLASIGVKTNLTKEEFHKCLDDTKMVISSQTENLCPLDKKVYALRDVTGTTNSVPLIASSIMSKKIASGAGKILIDLKCGKGALVENIKDARRLGNLMIKIGKNYDRKVICVITDMNNPLGNNIGNKIEVLEVIDILKNNKTNNLSKLCIELASYMCMMYYNIDLEAARYRVLEVLDMKEGYSKLLSYVIHQEGSLDIALPEPKYIYANKSGYIKSINSRIIGETSMLLGAGRKNKEDKIDYNAGIILKKTVGEKVKKGDVLLEYYGKDINIENILDAYQFSIFKPKDKDLIIEILK